jgi:hypothetical protein
MKYSNIYAAQAKLDNLFDQAKGLPADPEMRSHWAKYLCVLVSGYLETTISTILVNYLTRKAHPNIVNWISAELEGFINPNMTKTLDLVGHFNETWGAELERESLELKDSIDSIYALRNRIAHGEDTVLTMNRMLEYYKQAKKLVSIVDGLCV